MPAVRKNLVESSSNEKLGKQKKIKKSERKKEADILNKDDQQAAATNMDEKNGCSIKAVIVSPKGNSKKKGNRKAEANEPDLNDKNTLQNNEDELLLKNISPTKKAKTDTRSTLKSASNGKKETPSVEIHDSTESPKRGGRKTKVTEFKKEFESSSNDEKTSTAKVFPPKKQIRSASVVPRKVSRKAAALKEDKIKKIDVDINNSSSKKKEQKKKVETNIISNIDNEILIESDNSSIEAEQDGKKKNPKRKSVETENADTKFSANKIELVKSPKKQAKKAGYKAEKSKVENTEEFNSESESKKKGRKAEQSNSIKSDTQSKQTVKKRTRILSKEIEKELVDTDNEISSENDSKKKNHNSKNDLKGIKKSKPEAIGESAVEVPDGVAKVPKRNKKVKNDLQQQIDIPQKPESKTRRGQKRVAEVSEVIESPKKIEKIDTLSTKEKPTIKKAQKGGSELSPKVAMNKGKMNSTTTNFENIDFGSDKNFNLKISSWNVAGLKSWASKGCAEYLKYENPDIFCIQETKCTINNVPEDAKIEGYQQYWLCKQGGYAGVALFSKITPINIQYGIGNDEQDADDRIITVEYEDFFLVNTYVPNSGRGLVTLSKRLKWNDLFLKHIEKLNSQKPVIITGDMNVAHEEIDLANPKRNKRCAGFTQEERDGMTTFLSHGYVDVFRHFYPLEEKAFTFWSYMGNARSKNVGWRLDYFLVSKNLIVKCVDEKIRSEVKGSDHCPITLFLNTE